MLAAACWMGCTPKLNDGISTTQPAYTGTSFPNPLVLFNGQFAPGVGLIPGSNTVFLTPFCSDYSYDAGITIAIGNTTVTPIQGNGNLVFGVSTYDQSGGAVNCTSFFADLPVEPLDSSGNTTTVNLTSGGYTQATFEAMAQGFREVLDEDYLQYRIRSTAYLGEHLLAADVPIIEPPGGHAIYIDAAAVSPHIPRDQFPGQALLVGLYRHAGIRAVEIGSVMFGDGASQATLGAHPPLELVRLAIPRRVYTQSHIDYVVEAVVEVYQKRDALRGLRIVEAPLALRHFTARFEEI